MSDVIASPVAHRVGLDDLLRALNGLYVAIGQLPLRIAEALQLPEPVVVPAPPPELPVPVVNVPPVDLSPVSEEIQRVLTQATGVWTEALEKVTQALQRQRLQFNNVRVDDTGIVQRLDQLLEQNRVDTRFDYGGRTDDSPVYIGRAAPGTPTVVPGRRKSRQVVVARAVTEAHWLNEAAATPPPPPPDTDGLDPVLLATRGVVRLKKGVIA
jgi:hypothetical protein